MNAEEPSNELVFIDQSDGGIVYIEHGCPSELIHWHSHRHYELHLMVSTKGKVFVGDFIGRYEPGQLTLIGPNLPHNWVTDKSYSPVALRDMVILFDHQSIEKLISAFPEASEILNTLEMSRSGLELHKFDPELAKSLFIAVRDSKGIDRLMAFLKLLDQINRWAEKKILSTHKNPLTLSSSAQTKINEAVKFITDHYQDDLSLKKVADLVNMSESSFSRHFQKATSNKFVEFVNRVRIGKACILLADTDIQISSICFEVGFKNITNFNRQFVRLKKQTPGDYRKMVRSNLGKDRLIIER